MTLRLVQPILAFKNQGMIPKLHPGNLSTYIWSKHQARRLRRLEWSVRAEIDTIDWLLIRIEEEEILDYEGVSNSQHFPSGYSS